MLTIKNGMNSYVLKIVALLCMTIDHIAKYNADCIPVVARFANEMHLLGRIAAPLFMFLFAYSARYTHNRRQFLCRLYIIAMLTKLLECPINLCFGSFLGYPSFRNIIFTFFYTAVYIYLLEAVFRRGGGLAGRRLMALLGIAAITYVPDRLWHLADRSDFFRSFAGEYASVARSVLDAVCANPIHTEYGLPLILLGVVFYFVQTKGRQMLALAGFCLFWPMLATVMSSCELIQQMGQYLRDLPFVNIYMDGIQWFGMLLALPFMLLYNGESPNKHKYFFYGYYAVHLYVLVLLRALLS
ncbi:MAG: hypothetical protein IJB55_05785 [Firmicutes bacterium]|nr:hypothetical protein [Bacillota bacterium]